MKWRERAVEFAWNFSDRKWWVTRGTPALKRYALGNYEFVSVDRVDITAESWDTLILLDACRYDLFEEVSGLYLDGSLEEKYSPGSSTPEFVMASFEGRELHDTVYVTANPQAYLRLDVDDIFHDVIEVWINRWDESLRTVRPEVMVEETLAAREKYPKKRIIAHFMQPHYPFIGPKADRLIGNHSGYNWSRSEALNEDSGETAENVWMMLKQGTVTEDDLWESYRENLELCLIEIGDLLESVEEKVLITSDHGNSVGEKAEPFPIRIYGHPSRIHIPELITIPWFSPESETRLEVTSSEATTTTGSADDSVAKSRLEDLGYIT